MTACLFLQYMSTCSHTGYCRLLTGLDLKWVYLGYMLTPYQSRYLGNISLYITTSQNTR